MIRFFSAGLFLLATPAAVAADSVSALAGLTYSGSQSVLDDFDDAIAKAGSDPVKLAAIEKDLLAVLRRTDTTFAARQWTCQFLGTVLAAAAPRTDATDLKPLAAMLVDERDSDIARLALERAPGPAIDAMLLAALERATARPRLGLIDTLARRRVKAAVPALAKLLSLPDAPAASEAARALGVIGTSAAEEVLRSTKGPAPAVLGQARLAATATLTTAEATRVLQELGQDQQLPTSLRTAAFRRSLDLEPATATARIVEVLGGADWTYKQVALESLAGALPAERVSALVAQLGSWDAPTQTAVLGAIARSGSATAVPAVVAATNHPQAEVKSAAIAALGFLPGNREVVTLLATLAAGDTSDARIARQSLTRLSGAGVSAALLATAERGEPALRIAAIDQLALRHQTEALPFLLKCRTETDPGIRAAAVGALGELAPFSEQRSLLNWAIAATDDAEQSRALRALVNVTLRQREPRDRDTAISAAIESAQPDVAVRLLPALGRLGGSANADCAARLAIRGEAKVATAAVAALSRWTDATALPALATVVESAADAAARESARTGALQYLERSRDTWLPATTTVLSRLLAASKAEAPRRQLVALLARANDQTALELTRSLQTDAVVGEDARYAAAAISATLAGSPIVRTSTGTNAANLMDGKTSTRWSALPLGEEWVEIDFRQSRAFRVLTLDQTGRAADFPERYEVHVTDDLKAPGPAVVTGQGQRNKTVITLPAGTQGRYVIIKNTAERKDPWWAISELYLD